MRTKLLDFETELSAMKSEIDNLKVAIKKNDKCTEKLQWEQQSQDKQIQEMHTKIDQLEQQLYDINIIRLPDSYCNEEEEKHKMTIFAKDTLDGLQGAH